MSDLLKRVFIRARIKGKWESVSLQELMDRNEGQEILNWFLEKMRYEIDYKEGEIFEEKHAENIVNFLDAIGLTVIKIKPEVEY